MSVRKAPSTIDLGKQSRKRVKRFKEGRGRLVRKVARVVDEMREAGQISPTAQPVVIIVERRDRDDALFARIDKRLGW